MKHAQRIRVLQPQRDESDVRLGKVLLFETVYGTLFVSLRDPSIDETHGMGDWLTYGRMSLRTGYRSYPFSLRQCCTIDQLQVVGRDLGVYIKPAVQKPVPFLWLPLSLEFVE